MDARELNRIQLLLDETSFDNQWGLMQSVAGRIAADKGWDDKEVSFPESISLMHSELSEALEAYRSGGSLSRIDYHTDPNGAPKPEGVVVELADVLIRIMHWCSVNKVDIPSAVRAKLRYNLSRPYRHGGKKA